MIRRAHAYAAVFLGFFSTSALAQTAPTDQFIASIRESARMAGLSLSWRSETPNADGVVLGQVELGNASTGVSYVVDRIIAEGISMDADGRAVARRLVVSDEVFDVEGNGIGAGFDVAVNGLVFEGVATPAPGSTKLRDIAMHYDRMELGNLQVMVNGATLARFDNAYTTVDWQGDERLSFASGLGSFSVFSAEFPLLLHLGYPDVSGSAAASGTWSVADGRLAIKASLDLAQAFAIEASFDLSGYSRDLYARAASPGVSPAAMASDVMATSLAGAKITFRDKSFVHRALDLASVTNGKPVETVIEDVTGSIAARAPLLYLDVAKGAALMAAVQGFLARPATLSATIAPRAPLSLTGMSAGFPYPGDEFGLTLTRN